MKYLLLFFISILSFVSSFSQNRNMVWHFGEYAGVDFNNIPPTTSNNSNMSQEEGCATMCDNANGNLLFYTDGASVRDRNHSIMPNGAGLLGGLSSSQSSLILPMPGSSTIYFIFTTPETNLGNDPAAYSIVDMTLNTGLGDVTTKNVILYQNVGEQLTATTKADGTGYWIVVKELGSDAFISYSLTAAGVNSTPVISHAGISVAIYEAGCARISPNGSKLCVAFTQIHACELFDFDNNTGIVSNPIDLSMPNFVHYGVEFSPDNSKLYTTQYNSYFAQAYTTIVQYDLAAGSPIAIQNSGVEIEHENIGFPPIPPGYATTIMLGPDDKIYVSHVGFSSLAVITQPNLAGTACNYVTQGILLAPGTYCTSGLPNNIHYPVTVPCIPVSIVSNNVTICLNKTYQLPSGTVVSTPGIYADTIRSLNSCDSIIIIINLSVNDTSFSNQLDSIYYGQQYMLPSGQTVSSPGIYQSVLQNSNGCDSIINIKLILRKPLNDCLVLTNAFTPNGDGINDFWILYKYACFKKMKISVYNRYGSPVYHSDDYKNDWDGKYHNNILPDGTYYYVCKIMLFDGHAYEFKNNVTILK